MQVIILRGLPGSGKTTWARKLQEAQKLLPVTKDRGHDVHGAIILGADQYLEDESGEYKYDPKKVATAHQLCLQRFSQILYGPEDFDVRRTLPETVIVDNTNTRCCEIAPYYRLAEAWGDPVRVVTFPCTIRTSISRNIHKVPPQVIKGMARNMTEPLPPWMVIRTVGQEDDPQVGTLHQELRFLEEKLEGVIDNVGGRITPAAEDLMEEIVRIKAHIRKEGL